MIFVTQWFSGLIKPVHEGVYETCGRLGKIMYCYFDGQGFRNPRKTIELAYLDRNIQEWKYDFCIYKWRGLTKDK